MSAHLPQYMYIKVFILYLDSFIIAKEVTDTKGLLGAQKIEERILCFKSILGST